MVYLTCIHLTGVAYFACPTKQVVKNSYLGSGAKRLACASTFQGTCG